MKAESSAVIKESGSQSRGEIAWAKIDIQPEPRLFAGADSAPVWNCLQQLTSQFVMTRLAIARYECSLGLRLSHDVARRGEMIARFIESSQSDQRDRRVHLVALRIRSERKQALVGASRCAGPTSSMGRLARRSIAIGVEYERETRFSSAVSPMILSLGPTIALVRPYRDPDPGSFGTLNAHVQNLQEASREHPLPD
jgi:hypothetical protein